MTREKMMEELINDRIDTVQSMIYNEDYTFVDEIFRCGVDGFEDMCEEDLRQEYVNTFGGDFMCNNCGGGFTREEIKTDEDGDDYCTSCK